MKKQNNMKKLKTPIEIENVEHIIKRTLSNMFAGDVKPVGIFKSDASSNFQRLLLRFEHASWLEKEISPKFKACPCPVHFKKTKHANLYLSNKCTLQHLTAPPA